MTERTADQVAEHVARIDEHGYTIVEDAIEPALLDELDAALDRLEQGLGVVPATNDFEGRHTLRVYNLLVHGEVFERVPVHPNVLPIVEGVLDKGCLLSSLSSIAIGPDETPQPIHADDQLIPIPKPHPPVVCNTMWALTDFTEANGATRIVPGSHKDQSPDYGRDYPSLPAEMTRGGVLIWHGSMWHGGGANTTEVRRVGLACNYCAGYVRQQENQQLGVPLKIAKGFDERLQRLCGYSVYNGLIGHIDKHDPIELLREDGDLTMIWDNT
ncbi:MAG TPA: phytanoyl-CoA dioxygenase family protein [Acidimicrobiales bacterium]|jgi:ectoine hydroxylase-related dioxygenase (phytanoyl-CoA dioxygenase family)